MRNQRSVVRLLPWCLLPALVALGPLAAQPPAKDAPEEEPAKLNETIEKSVQWYDVFPDGDATEPVRPQPVLRWRNVTRGQKGEAMMVVWAHNGRPVAAASIYPWAGGMNHEFDSLSRDSKLVARENGKLIWSPATAGVEFKEIPGAPRPARSAGERLLQMKAICGRFKATMTGWQADNADQEELRLLPRPLFRYETKKATDPDLIDGALFAYVMGTDPEVLLALEAVGPADKAVWQYACVRATSGGLEVRLDNAVVWTAEKHPRGDVPNRPHFTMHRNLEP